MNIKFHGMGDDLFKDRLFSYLSRMLSVEVIGLIQLRRNVWIVKTAEKKMILKGFRELRKLRIQEAFLSDLRKKGFEQTYCFIKITKEPLLFQNEVYGCIEYIDPHSSPFHYANEKDKWEGIHLLDYYHAQTKELVMPYSLFISKMDLYQKWVQRKNEFLNNIPEIHIFMNREFCKEMVEWADFSLKGMQKFDYQFQKNDPVILHGDVAHHNFLRSKNGKLHLIDYDLMSIGSAGYDLLQFANRILPYYKWSISALEKLPQIKSWMSNEAFLYGLIYPSDVFREWNRFFRVKKGAIEFPSNSLLELTTSQFRKRRLFVKEIQRALKGK